MYNYYYSYYNEFHSQMVSLILTVSLDEPLGRFITRSSIVSNN